jgi:beta-lactam-binding protein with PASTA domain
MSHGGRIAALGTAVLATACLLTSCSNGPTSAQKKAVRTVLTTTTTSTPPTTSTSSSTSTQPGVAVPNVIGLKIAAARGALRAAGFPSVSLNTSCNKGTLASQSVVASLASPGKAPDVSVGAVPLQPGVAVSPGTRIGINWSGCYGDASDVPAVVGLSFPAARQAIHAAGLVWACFSVGEAPTTTTTHAPKTRSTSEASTTTTLAPETTTTVKVVQVVLTQSPAAHTVLHPGATVTLTMHHCPQ